MNPLHAGSSCVLLQGVQHVCLPRAVHSGERGCYRSNRKNYRIDRIELRKKMFSAVCFFSWGGLGGRSRSNHFKKFAKANFLKWCRGGVWGGLPPQESPLPVPCPPGGSVGLRPLRNLRYPCLAPAARRTDGEKSKNELQGSYRPKNLTI